MILCCVLNSKVFHKSVIAILSSEKKSVDVTETVLFMSLCYWVRVKQLVV